MGEVHGRGGLVSGFKQVRGPTDNEKAHRILTVAIMFVIMLPLMLLGLHPDGAWSTFVLYLIVGGVSWFLAARLLAKLL